MKELELKARIHAKCRDHSYKRDEIRKANNLIKQHLRLLNHLKSARQLSQNFLFLLVRRSSIGQKFLMVIIAKSNEKD